MFSALYPKHPKRCNVGDTLRALIFDEDGNEVNPDDVNAEIQWSADGKEITAETDAEYTVLVGDVGVVLSVEVTIGDDTYTAKTEKVEAAEEPVEELTVTIVSEDEIPTVGELLTAVVTDEDGELVDAELLHYQWYAGEDAIDESDTAILLVTDEFVGKTLSVEVTDADGNTFKSEPTAEVEAGEPVEELTVSIDNPSPKVGDILTAEVVDRNGEDVSDNVTFQWYADDVAIEGADEETLVVDNELLGAALKVVVTAENGNTFSSDETEEVGVYEALTLISAEQTGKNKVQVTFSAPATADDKLTVTRGATAQTFTEAFDDDTYLTKTLTFKNNLVSGTYTVTLTPADEDVDPSSVEFEAESATKAATLEIENKYLVMKNAEFQEGYFFIKGYNGIGEENDGKGEEIKPLTGLNINVAPSDSVSYDPATGKVTVKYANPGFAVIQKVSVFAQYTGKDGNIIICQETLDVSTIGYPSNIEFGDVKKDGTPRKDGLITIAELGSNKYYVELDSVQDQYGNELSANDLNDLKTNGFLTVVPDANSPIYFGTNVSPFSTKDGKVVVFLTPSNNGLPGDGQLMITGAGGTFSKDISISDDPYINVLNVTVPDLYEGEWSDAFEFEATDQYGDPINLYDFVPVEGERQGTLTFTDKNHKVNKQTSIQAETAGTWKVKKDTAKKTYEITYKPAGNAKSIATFTTIPAGLLATGVQTKTIGTKGTSAQIEPQASAATIKLDGTSKIVESLKFIDANGKTMDRIDASDVYPRFLGYDATTNTNDPTNTKLAKNIETNAKIKDEDIKAYYWVVSNTKLDTDSTKGGTVNAKALKAAGEWYDADGVIAGDATYKDKEAAAAAGTAAIAPTLSEDNYLKVSVMEPVMTYYVTLLGDTNTTTAGPSGTFKVLDSQAFRFIYVPTSQNNVKYTVDDTSKKLLYAVPGSGDGEEIKVTATNDAGESWSVDAADISLTPDAPFTSTGNVVNGDIAAKRGKGSVSVKVYVNDPVEGIIDIDTVQIAYDDADPVATSTSKKLTTTGPSTIGAKPEGVVWSPAERDEFTTAAGARVKMENGVFEITNATVWSDTYTASIKDQYDQVMKNSTAKMDGYEMGVAPANALTAGDKGNFVITNGSQKIDLDVIAGGAVTISAAKSDADVTVTKASELLNALDAAAAAAGKTVITIDGDITTSDALTIPATTELVIPRGTTLTVNANVTNNGVIRGSKAVGENTASTCGHMTISGTPVTNATLTGGTVDLAGSSLELSNVEIKGNVNLIGHVIFSDSIVVSGNVKLDGTAVAEDGTSLDLTGGSIELAKDATLDLSKADSYTGLSGAIKIGTDDSGDPVEGWSVKVGGSTEGNEGQTDLDTNLAVAEFKNTYKALLDLADDDDWSDNTIDATLLAKALAEFEDGGSVEGLQSTDLADEYNLLLKIQEWLVIDGITSDIVALGSNSTATQTTFTMPAVDGVDLAGAKVTAYKVDEAAGSTTLSAPVALNSEGSTTVEGLAGLTAGCKVVFTIETALKNELEVTVTTEEAEVSGVGNATSETAGATYNSATGTAENVFTGGTSTIYAYDQYGVKISTAITNPVDVTATLSADDEPNKFSAASYTVAANGAVTISVTSAGALSEDDAATVTIGGDTITIRCTTAHNVDTADGAVSFTVASESV